MITGFQRSRIGCYSPRLSLHLFCTHRISEWLPSCKVQACQLDYTLDFTDMPALRAWQLLRGRPVRYVFALTLHGRLQCVHIETGSQCGDNGAWLGESALPETTYMSIDSSGLYIAIVAIHPQPPPKPAQSEVVLVEAGSGRIVARASSLPELSCVSWSGETLLLGTTKGGLLVMEVRI